MYRLLAKYTIYTLRLLWNSYLKTLPPQNTQIYELRVYADIAGAVKTVS